MFPTLGQQSLPESEMGPGQHGARRLVSYLSGSAFYHIGGFEDRQQNLPVILAQMFGQFFMDLVDQFADFGMDPSACDFHPVSLVMSDFSRGPSGLQSVVRVAETKNPSKIVRSSMDKFRQNVKN